MPHRLKDRLWRLNNLYPVITEKGEKVVFKLKPVQESLMNNLHWLNIYLKSRQHGITTFFCIFALDMALFNSNVRCGIIAHTRGDAESFFKDKVKFAYDNILLPEIKEKITAKQDSAKELLFSNNSAIRVGTSHRSGTFQFLHISEFGKICARDPQKAREIVTGALNTIHEGAICSIESTAEGNSGYFYDYVTKAKNKMIAGKSLTRLDWKFNFYAWFQDERNKIDDKVNLTDELEIYFKKVEQTMEVCLGDGQKAWYALKLDEQGSDMKREHPSTPEEAFAVSIQGAYFKTQIEIAYREKRIIPFHIEPDIAVDTWWDLGMNDTTCVWFTQDIGRELRVIDYYQNSGEGFGHYATILRNKGYQYGKHTGPHDLKVRELSGDGRSRKDTWREKYGIEFEVCKKLSKVEQIEAARSIFAKCYFNETKCSKGIKGLENYKKTWDKKNGCYLKSPLHNWASNPADAFMILGVAHKSKNTGINSEQINRLINRKRSVMRR